MNNQDKIFEQFKKAADNAESKDFPGLETVWTRVEHKLDKKVLSKQNRKWKQWAVAASVVAMASVGYQVYKTETGQAEPKTEKIYIVKGKYIPKIETETQIASADTVSSVLRPDAETVLRNQTQNQTATAQRAEENPIAARANTETVTQDEALAIKVPSLKVPNRISLEKLEKPQGDDASEDFLLRKRTQGVMAKGRVFDADVVVSDTNKSAKPKKIIVKPLLVVDGYPLVAKSQEEYDERLREIMKTVPTERDTTFFLRSPLYIINGTEYSEESLFGSNPTSPYAPLNLQEEGMTTRVYTGKDAIKRYGEKGKNGVIVIKTKDGKPAPRKKK